MSGRWWVYQKERFPVLAHGGLLLTVSGGAIGLSALLRGAAFPGVGALTIGFLTTFLFFFQLRVADEFKDFQEDARYRPQRPVPRGVVSLKELAWLGSGAAALQVLLNLWLNPALLPFVLLVWAYMALMRFEFFAPRWLKARPLAYLVSHMAVMPLIYLYLSACDWVVAGARFPLGYGWFLAAAFFNGMVIEIGRKLRAPQAEQAGVDTYSAVWGYRRASLAWLGVMLASWALVLAAATSPSGAYVFVVQGVVFLLAVVVVWRYISNPSQAKWFEVLSAVWTLLLHLTAGLVPWAWPFGIDLF